MDGARLPVWLIVLAAMVWGAVVAWRWTASHAGWRSVAGLSLLAYLAMLGLQLKLPAPSGSSATSILLAVGCGTAALAIGANSSRLLLAAWLTVVLTVSGALLAMGEAAGAALTMILSAGGFLPWWATSINSRDVAEVAGAEQIEPVPPAPVATIAALSGLTLGIWGAIHSAAIHEAGRVSPGGQHSALLRDIVSETELPVLAAAPQRVSAWSRPELLGTLGILFFVGMLGVTSSDSNLAAGDRQHINPA